MGRLIPSPEISQFIPVVRRTWRTPPSDIYIIGIINGARRDSRQSGQIARGQNWTVEIIATSADALAVNPRLWPAICHGKLGAIRHGGFLPICDATRGNRRWRGKFRSLPVFCFQHTELPATGKYCKLMCHQQIITRYRNHHYPVTLPPSPLPPSSSMSLRGEKFLSRPETSGA